MASPSIVVADSSGLGVASKFEGVMYSDSNGVSYVVSKKAADFPVQEQQGRTVQILATSRWPQLAQRNTPPLNSSKHRPIFTTVAMAVAMALQMAGVMVIEAQKKSFSVSVLGLTNQEIVHLAVATVYFPLVPISWAKAVLAYVQRRFKEAGGAPPPSEQVSLEYLESMWPQLLANGSMPVDYSIGEVMTVIEINSENAGDAFGQPLQKVIDACALAMNSARARSGTPTLTPQAIMVLGDAGPLDCYAPLLARAVGNPGCTFISGVDAVQLMHRGAAEAGHSLRAPYSQQPPAFRMTHLFPADLFLRVWTQKADSSLAVEAVRLVSAQAQAPHANVMIVALPVDSNLWQAVVATEGGIAASHSLCLPQIAELQETHYRIKCEVRAEPDLCVHMGMKYGVQLTAEENEMALVAAALFVPRDAAVGAQQAAGAAGNPAPPVAGGAPGAALNGPSRGAAAPGGAARRADKGPAHEPAHGNAQGAPRGASASGGSSKGAASGGARPSTASGAAPSAAAGPGGGAKKAQVPKEGCLEYESDDDYCM